MNVAINRLMYQSRAAPLEKQLTFDELQNRPLGFQSAIPRDPIGEAMNSLEFKSMEGAMYEGAAYASKMLRSEQMNEVMVAEAAAQNGIPHNVVHEFVQQQDGQLPQAQQNTGSMWQRMFGQQAEQRLQDQQFERMQQQAGIDQAAAIHAAAEGRATAA